MPTNTIIDIPPAVGKTVSPGTITFDVSSDCTVCFGTADPAGSFPDLEDETFEWTGGLTYGPYTADTADAEIPYNTSDPGTPCSTVGPAAAVHTIHVGSGFGSAKPGGKAKAAGKTKAKTKAKAKPKAKAKLASKAKPAPKTKAKSKAKPKPKTKAKTKSKAKPKTKKGGKSKR